MNNPLHRYTRSKAYTSSPINLVYQIFMRCADHAQSMAMCVEHGDDFKRFEHSEKIVYALTQFSPMLEDGPLSGSPLHQEYQNFFTYIMTALIEANTHKSQKICKDIQGLFIEFANIWKNL